MTIRRSRVLAESGGGGEPMYFSIKKKKKNLYAEMGLQSVMYGILTTV